MKYLKKKKKSILPWVLLALTVVLVALILMLTLLPGEETPSEGSETVPTAQNGEEQPITEPNPKDPTHDTLESQAPTASTEATVPPVAQDLRIETPYVTLVYPGALSSHLHVEKLTGNPYRVIFTAELDSGIRQELFTIAFGGSTVGAMGVVKVSGEEIPVHVSAEDIAPGKNWSDKDITTIFAMQEALNDVLSGLNLTSPQDEPVETQPETLPPEDEKYMIIDTPAGELIYPARWKDYLKLETREAGVYTLEFYSDLEGFDPVPLFNIYLGGDKGIYVMDLTASDGSVVKLFVDIFEIEPNIDWTDAQNAIVYAMQEDMNVLLSALME